MFGKKKGKKDGKKCGATVIVNGKTYICQREEHTIWPSAKHWDDRDGGCQGWSEAFAEQQRQDAAKEAF
jgi:hypothetical protein